MDAVNDYFLNDWIRAGQDVGQNVLSGYNLRLQKILEENNTWSHFTVPFATILTCEVTSGLFSGSSKWLVSAMVAWVLFERYVFDTQIFKNIMIDFFVMTVHSYKEVINFIVNSKILMCPIIAMLACVIPICLEMLE